ncbi:MAG: hypothetical protein LBH06_09220 [Rikenellaceae bacterium]|jgi:hypothetical protein|nr:hypothetical protein [Rikenellaceae bacterium]
MKRDYIIGLDVVKAILTRSGHVIEFNDNINRNWGITIKDRHKNIIHIDTGKDGIDISANKDVCITAGETMTIKAKTLNIVVEEEMTAYVGKDQKTTVGGKVDNTQNELKSSTAGDVAIEAGGKLSEKAGDVQMGADGDFIIKCDGKDPDNVKPVGGCSSAEGNIILFQGYKPHFVSHEMLHSLGPAHSFTNREANRNAIFTYQSFWTENLMDYSHKFH